MHRRSALRQILYTAAGVCLPGLPSQRASATEPHPVQQSYAAVTDEQEIELGNRLAASAERSLETVTGGGLDTYLNGMVHRLARASQRPTLPYRVQLVNSPQINAFSIAGGHLYVHRGLIEATETEAELAATLGHEIGHIVGRHSINQLVRELQARRMLTVVLANLSSRNGIVERVFERMGGLAALLALLHYSRVDENEADLLGFYEMLRAGWDPHGMLSLFSILDRAGAQSSRYLSSHPPTPERIVAIRRELAETKLPAGLRTDSVSFQNFKRTVSTLPAPGASPAMGQGAPSR